MEKCIFRDEVIYETVKQVAKLPTEAKRKLWQDMQELDKKTASGRKEQLHKG